MTTVCPAEFRGASVFFGKEMKRVLLYILTVCPAFLAGMIQGVTGFGAGILLMLFYPFCFSMVQSTFMCQFLCAVLCVSIVWRYRHFVCVRLCVLPLLFYFPVYFIFLRVAIGLNMDGLKPVLGIFLMILAVYFIVGEGKIQMTAGVKSAFLCAALAGIIDAFFGIGGPTMVIYFMAVLEDKKKYLGTIQLFFMMTNLYGTIMRSFSGQLNPGILLPLAVGAAVLLVGAWAGSRIVDRIDIAKMKTFVYGFIGVAGLITLVTGL